MLVRTLLVLASGVTVLGQRPSFAGSRPIGYPELYDLTTTTQANGLGNRFGEGDSTTQRLPLEVNGDKALFDRLSKLPIDKQPYWLLNWQALEEQRKKPQTYPQRPSPFNDQLQNVANPSGPILNNNAVPLTGELENRNGGPGTTNRPDPGYHYPDIFSPTKVEDTKTDASSNLNSNFNGGALSFVSTTTRRPQPPKRVPVKPLVAPQSNKQIPVVGNRNSNHEVKETNSGTFSATNAFQNGNSVFSNYNSVVKSTNNVDPQGNKVVVQTSGAPGPDAPFQLTNKGVFVPNPAVMNTAGIPNIPNIPNFDPATFNQPGLPQNADVTKYYTTSSSSGGPGMNSSVVNSNAGFHNTNSVSKNATHYNSSYQNTYHYSYSFQNKYVIPHGGGAPVKVDSQSSGFPVQNGGLPNSNVQFVPSTSPNVNVQNTQSNVYNQQRVIQTPKSPPVTRVVSNPKIRQSSSDYSYYDYN